MIYAIALIPAVVLGFIGGDIDVTVGTIIAGASPLIYATIGETITEKAGVVNLSARRHACCYPPWQGLQVPTSPAMSSSGSCLPAAVSAAVALIIAYASIELKLNQIAVGFVLFLLATDLSSLLGTPYVRQPGPSVPKLSIPLLADIPFLGKALFQHNLSIYGSIVLIGVTYWFFYRTRRGLELQAVGERPEAAFARGISVRASRYFYTLLGGRSWASVVPRSRSTRSSAGLRDTSGTSGGSHSPSSSSVAGIPSGWRWVPTSSVPCR